MLGYVVAYKPELKVKDYELYKAYYCGICKSIGRRYGQLPRMALSFDSAFLAILIDSLIEPNIKIDNESCIANPFKKKSIASVSSTPIAADIMLILVWYKILDDIKDNKSFSALLLKLRYKSTFRKLRCNYEELCKSIENYLDIFDKLEADKSNHLDMVSDSFSKIMESIFETCFIKNCGENKELNNIGKNPNKLEFVNEAKQRLSLINNLKQIGYHLGKWIYIIDAFDDIDENLLRKTYNPLFFRYSIEDGETSASFKKRISSSVWQILMICLEKLSDAFEKLPINHNKEILDNIIYIGLFEKTKSIVKETLNEPI